MIPLPGRTILGPLLLALLAACPSSALALSASEILTAVDDLWRGQSSYARMSMEVVTEHWQRTLEMKAWSRGKDDTLVVITAPARERGVATLKTREEIWNYLPRVNRTIRVPSSMMMADWMGSHFTNDDLVKESRMSEDYDARVTFEGEREGRSLITLTLTPLPQAPVVWGSIEITVTADGYLPLEALYFDEEGVLVRTMIFSRIRELGGRLMPTLLTLLPKDKPGEKTVITYSEMSFGLGLDDDFFSISNLSSRELSR